MCDSNGIEESADVRFVKDFMAKITAAFLASRLSFKNRKKFDEPEGMLHFWKEVVSDLLEIYGADDVTSETEIEIQNLKQRSNMTPDQYAKTMRTKALMCNRRCSEYTLKSMFVKVLPDCNCSSTRL